MKFTNIHSTNCPVTTGQWCNADPNNRYFRPSDFIPICYDHIRGTYTTVDEPIPLAPDPYIRDFILYTVGEKPAHISVFPDGDK